MNGGAREAIMFSFPGNPQNQIPMLTTLRLFKVIFMGAWLIVKSVIPTE
jgi:hypothetical protein